MNNLSSCKKKIAEFSFNYKEWKSFIADSTLVKGKYVQALSKTFLSIDSFCWVINVKKTRRSKHEFSIICVYSGQSNCRILKFIITTQPTYGQTLRELVFSNDTPIHHVECKTRHLSGIDRVEAKEKITGVTETLTD